LDRPAGQTLLVWVYENSDSSDDAVYTITAALAYVEVWLKRAAPPGAERSSVKLTRDNVR
jgi:hypothetical protein